MLGPPQPHTQPLFPGRLLLPLLPLLLLHTPALAYDPGTGSAVGGNLSAAAPWGLPPDEFESATRSPDASAAYNVTGYNVSSSAPGPQAAAGWELAAAIKYDTPLADAARPPGGGGGRRGGDVFQATTLYVKAPDGMALGGSWRLCAAVWPGVAGNTSAVAVDGTCLGVLSAGCAKALGVAGASGAGGMDGAGECVPFALPGGCRGEFPAGTGDVSSFAINQTVLDAGRFYAYGSEPSGGRGNATARGEALGNVWPVALVFGHLAPGGGRVLSSANAAVQCVRATNGTTVDDELPGSGSAAAAAAAAAAPVLLAALAALGALGAAVLAGSEAMA